MSDKKMPAEKENKKAAEEMNRAIDATVKQEKQRGIGNDQMERKAADELRRNAQSDTGRTAK